MALTWEGKRFEGQVLVVTGGTDGLGLAVSKRILQEGGKVVICSRKQEKVDEALKQLKQIGPPENVQGIAAHAAKDEDRKKVIDLANKSYGKIDMLFLNAAMSPPLLSLLDDVPKDTFEKHLDLNVSAPLEMVRLAKPTMPKGGSVVITSSMGGYGGSKSPHPAYTVTKTAEFGLTKALAAELAPDIRVNCLAAGMFESAFSQPLWDQPDLRKGVEESVFMGRRATVEEMAAPVCFLFSKDAGFITGEILGVHGGASSRL